MAGLNDETTTRSRPIKTGNTVANSRTWILTVHALSFNANGAVIDRSIPKSSIPTAIPVNTCHATVNVEIYAWQTHKKDHTDYSNLDAGPSTIIYDRYVLGGDTLVIKGFSVYDFDTRTSTSWHCVYTKNTEGQWIQSQQVAVDSYSTSIALDNDTVQIGAPGSNGAAYRSGAVVVYQRSTTGEWVVTTTLLAGVEIDSFGSSTALDGHNVLAIGSHQGSTRVLFYSLID